jgi:hypothetical protein
LPSPKDLSSLEAVANRVEWALTGRGSGPPKRHAAGSPDDTEEALRRLEEAVGRLEAAAGSGPPSTAPAGRPSRKQLGELEAIANRLEWALKGRGSGAPKLPAAADRMGEDEMALHRLEGAVGRVEAAC